MKILIVHQGYPGQFKHLLPVLKERGDTIYAIVTNKVKSRFQDNANIACYSLYRGNGSDTHPLCVETESKVLRGESVAKVAIEAKKNGFTPDLILCHPGWGEALFLKEVWKETPQLHYTEYMYSSIGSDLDFDKKLTTPNTWDIQAKCKMKNASILLSLNEMDWGITPTPFQYSTLPKWAQHKTSIIHDGIDTDWATPDCTSTFKLNCGKEWKKGNQIISFVNRTFEPYRGIHVFVEALEHLMKKNKEVDIVLIGEDTPKVSYGSTRSDGVGWLSHLKKEFSNRIDWTRVYAPGKISHNLLRDLFRVTAAHIYLTYPFVLSWSMLEAMSCEALVIGSETAPVQDVISHGVNGLLVPFNNPVDLAICISEVLEKQTSFLELRKKARETIISGYDLRNCIRKQIALIDAVANKSITDAYF